MTFAIDDPWDHIPRDVVWKKLDFRAKNRQFFRKE